MSDLPPPLISPSVPARAPSWPALVAWLAIIVCVVFVVVRNYRPSGTDSMDSLKPQVMKIDASMVLGLKALVAKTKPAPPPQFAQSMDNMVKSFDQTAKTPEEKFCVAIIAGEVNGKDAALNRLGDIAQDHPSADLAQDIADAQVLYQQGPSALDPPTQARFIQHQGFFARLALIFGSDPGSPERLAIQSTALRTFITLGIVGLAMLLLMAASLVCFIIAIVMLAQGKIRRAYVPNPAANSAYLESFALYLALFIGYALVIGVLVSPAITDRLRWELPLLLILPLVMYWPVFRGATFAEIRRGFGWHTGRGLHVEIPLGIVGYLAGLPVVAVGLFITSMLMKVSGAPTDHPIVHMLEGNRWHMVMLYLLAAGFAPLMEETMFRGALFHHLRRRWGWWISAPIVSFIFAIIHPQGWAALPVLGSMALVFAAIREWRGSILPSMAAHAFNNAFALTIALLILR